MSTLSTDIAFGLEIETPWQTMLARVDPEAAELLGQYGSFYKMTDTAKDRVQVGFDKLDAEYKERVDGVFGDDIKRGKDSYVEFALQPKRDINDIIATTQGLYDLDILREGEHYPLQLTIGNVPARPPAYYLLMAVEICGGSTPERMAEVNTWSRRGVGGIWPRKSAEMQLGMSRGVEFRSLTLTGMERLERALKIAEKGGRLIVDGLANNSDAKERLGGLQLLLKTRAAEKGIHTSKVWWSPLQEPEHWTDYVEALRDKEWREKLETDIVLLLG